MVEDYGLMRLKTKRADGVLTQIQPHSRHVSRAVTDIVTGW